MWGLVVAFAISAVPSPTQGSTAPPPAVIPARVEQVEFLRTAKVIRIRQLSSGVTSPWPLTVTDGVMTHDAGFQTVDQRRAVGNFGDRGGEANFVDSHHFNLAACTIAGMLGLDEMMPVTVRRTWNDGSGTITWWIDDAIDERTRLKEQRQAPNPVAWAQQCTSCGCLRRSSATPTAISATSSSRLTGGCG